MARPQQVASAQLFLFGGSTPWITSVSKWAAIDDRVRGGSSQSYLTPVPKTNHVRFCGTLDTKTLGGAGFASQTTTADDKVWDLSAYDGIEIDVVEGDGKMYTLILKDEVPEGKKRDDGREKAGISWEYDFKASEVAKEKGEQQKFRIPWDQFKATYRGREKKDAEPLKTDGIRRFSLMMRSFFGTQEGDFKVELSSISAVKKDKSSEKDLLRDIRQTAQADKKNQDEVFEQRNNGGKGWLSWLPGNCVVS
ncbi:hypothetical protein MMC24_000376 [Lignoscripta atroalba]|nr:hypothetical protein [Lignoscripta atroalba]